MSPFQAMERSYAALKALLREGAYPPGHRLEANRIAEEIGVSMTPVRDALNRLVGERIVEASSGEGFHVPRLAEGDLRDLYEWHSAVAIMAARTARRIPDEEAIAEALATKPLADATAAVFRLLAESAPNRELRPAVENISERLHPFRIAEEKVSFPMIGHLEEILDPAKQLAAIRRYHLVRMKSVEELIRLRTKL
ncbi:GntR family transcriptional regulator [Sphingomonas canadensis]|uniref:GntR family transcriptional regulator n=1 Tax=Sphingomonas canadensis TaxID=1219257 RepID=A0ABW3HBB8_9SPHN|nr:GntR family transcriptional regulator [Sphingomonas canadensis]MCW3838186.1 GntR family transcriptional regulator [Sphingomonas canadensis]